MGRLIEERRARRDHITKLFEASREEVRRSVEVAIDCFSTKPAERKPIQEAKVLAADRELRSALSLLLSRARNNECLQDTQKAQKAFEDYMAELTGGNFQSKMGKVQQDHIIRIVYSGAALRVGLARLRDAELKARTNSDPVFRPLHSFWQWLSQPSRRFSETTETDQR